MENNQSDEKEYELYLVPLKKIIYKGNIRKISYSNDSILFLSGNKVLCYGSNSFHKFGDLYESSFNNKIKEIKHFKLNECINVYNSYSFAFYVTKKECLASGCGEDGRTGTYNFNKNIFDKVLIKDKVLQIACTSVCSYFLTDKNELYSTGKKYYNCFMENITVPKLIDFFDNIKIKKLCSNNGHSYHVGVLTDNYEIYLWGHNRVGQCGMDPTKLQNIKDTSLDLNDRKIITKPFKIKYKGIDLKIGWGHTCIINPEYFYLFGKNNDNQLYKNRNHMMKSMGSTYNFQSNRIVIDDLSKIKLSGSKTLFLINNELFSTNPNNKKLKRIDSGTKKINEIINDEYILSS